MILSAEPASVEAAWAGEARAVTGRRCPPGSTLLTIVNDSGATLVSRRRPPSYHTPRQIILFDARSSSTGAEFAKLSLSFSNLVHSQKQCTTEAECRCAKHAKIRTRGLRSSEGRPGGGRKCMLVTCKERKSQTIVVTVELSSSSTREAESTPCLLQVCRHERSAASVRNASRNRMDSGSLTLLGRGSKY